ncbi:MAG TPA: cytochrome c oxidase subunit II [Gemmatimonadales bacterium]
MTVGLVLVFVACSGDPYPQSTLHPTSDGGTAIDRLFSQIFWWAVVVFVVVESALLYTVIRFRARPERGDPKHVHGNTLMEISWTLAPAAILVFIAVPTILTIFETDGSAPANAIQVEVIGHQWWWEFRYPQLDLVTANELHIPQGHPVQLIMSSADVIHSFWVPKLHGKRDVMPGRTTRLAFTADSVGTFLGQCAEFCGASHANMRMRVMVQAPSEFDAWVQAQRQSTPVDTADRRVVAGRQLFGRTCIACHAIDGIGGAIGPDLSHVGSRTTIAAGILPNDSAGLTRWIGNPGAEKPGNLMPQFPLEPDDLAALVAYLRSRR